MECDIDKEQTSFPQPIPRLCLEEIKIDMRREYKERGKYTTCLHF